jgi:hypothetical protein
MVKEERSVVVCYVSTGLPRFFQDSMPNNLPEIHRYEINLYRCHSMMSDRV